MRTRACTREDVAARLRAREINLTHQRVEIAMVLFSRMEHLSADQVLAAVNERAAEVSKATVYNTLKLFIEKGLVREVIVDPTRVFYDPNVCPHHHVFDVGTGELHDLGQDAVSVSVPGELPEGLVAESVEVVIRARQRQSL